MTDRIHGFEFPAVTVGCLIVLGLGGGCAPARLGSAIAYQAERAAVTDAAARHTTSSPYYRFNTAILSDLDDAITCTDPGTMRALAGAILRDANALSQSASTNEIDRMPVESLKQLASLSGIKSSARALSRQFADLATAALQSDLEEVARLTPSEMHHQLVTLREGVEDLPDDKGRSKRQALYAWAALLTANGIAREESHLTEKCIAKAEKQFDRIAIWHPRETNGTTLMTRYAPIIGVEWPLSRHYDTDYDRIGGVKLSRKGRRIEVHIDPEQPTVYSYATEAKIDGQLLRQLNYVWWFSDRPEMKKNDPVAGHIDGAMIRITLDAADKPLFVESSLNCGCAHEVFVSKRVESAARDVFGTPLSGKRFVVEKIVPEKHDVVVVGSFDTPSNHDHPLVLCVAGYHEVFQVIFESAERSDSLEIVEDAPYQLADYGSLDALPLGDGNGSMFGSDGLVHYAGRREGFLLAPSGMLSAGQPRKRGTQRVRWDDYLHDDPRLLEKTLRLPPLN